MQLVLYKNISSDNTLNKVLTNGTVFNINLKRETDILNPDLFLVKLTGVDYNDFNYAEIVELKRFYFINSITMVNASLFKLECSTDVLETYKTEILTSEASFKKSIQVGDYGEVDLKTSTKKLIEFFDSDLELEPSNDVILSVLGVH